MTNTTIKGLLIASLLCGCGEATLEPFGAPGATDEVPGPSGGGGQVDEGTGGVLGSGGTSGSGDALAGGASGRGGDDDIGGEGGAGGEEDDDGGVDDDA